MIEKPVILVTSLGRTGTEFFSNFFDSILPDCTSLHEPNTFAMHTRTKNRYEEYARQIQRAGIWRMVILKTLGQWNLAKLSDLRFSGKLSHPQAAQKLLQHRADFIAKMPGSIYAEANLGYYGLLDIIPDVFKYHKEIYVIRDGRDWVRSHLNWGELYGNRGTRKIFGHQWPTARDVPGDDSYAQKWDDLTQFEKLCWAWAKLNEYALGTMDKTPHVRLFRFEEIFSGEDRYAHLDELVRFATALPGIDPKNIRPVDGWLERKSHQSLDGFPAWEQWTTAQKQHFEQVCGPLMQKLGYKLD